ncbi:NUDIX domain-containing protein [Vogesella indigofera]|uniref:NUDIX domain-containing protein n=1 Tax=Vogesella indigofera TaxID=45465 RepID=UPI00234E610E|nr:NUDIX domain-containing protein [Vogesella indigofera]MDC7707886.1 NUDIX hydrolase [Vogesella indigofera]
MQIVSERHARDTRLCPTLPRRATAIIELPDGVLMTASANSRFSLPGGVSQRGELRSQALIRQIRDQTGLRINSMLYLFDHITQHNAHKVYLVIAQGQPRLQEGGSRLTLVTSPDADMDIHIESRAILRRYAKLRGEEGAKSEAVRAMLKLARYIAKVE